MSGAFLGADIGSSGLKIIVVADGGEVLARGSAGYPTSYPGEGRAEQDPATWMDALAEALSRVAPEVRSRITALGAVGHVPSLVLVDADVRPLRPAIIWQDNRAEAEAARLAADLGAVEGDLGTDVPWAPSQLLPKLAWVAAHEPGIRAAARWALQPKDVLNHALTGVVATDPWSSKGICDVREGSPAARLLAGTGWDDTVSPPARAPWEVLGTLTPQAAERLGLREDVVVATGWTDALGAIHAVGAFDSPRGFVLTGTSNIVGVSRADVATAEGLYSVPVGPSAPLPLLYGPTQSGGEALTWAARLLGVDVPEVIALAASADPASAPLFVPYLRGERAPLWNPAARGLLVGVDAAHGRAEFARAVVGGIAYSARHVLDLAAGDAVAADLPVEVGGVGVDDPRWAAMWAAALGRPLHIHSEPNLSALGAALLGAQAAGATAAEVAGLRSAPAEFTPEHDRGDDAAFPAYLDASRVADEWSRR